jgi:hypothetical protein
MEIRKNPQVDVVELYQRGLALADIAELSGITRQGIWARLHRAGVQPSRRQGRISAVCGECGSSFQSPPASRVDHSKAKRRFCSSKCQRAYLSNPNYRESRYGGMRSRSKVSFHFDLRPEYVVHHLDENQGNAALHNLVVFASQSDHLRFHHGDETVKPIWDGRQCGCDACKMLRG